MHPIRTLVEFKSKPEEVYRTLSEYSDTDRIFMIYNYSVALFEYGKKWGIVTDRHTSMWQKYIDEKLDHPARDPVRDPARNIGVPVFDMSYLQTLAGFEDTGILEETLRTLLKTSQVKNIDYLKSVISTGDAELVQQVLIDITTNT